MYEDWLFVEAEAEEWDEEDGAGADEEKANDATDDAAASQMRNESLHRCGLIAKIISIVLQG